MPETGIYLCDADLLEVGRAVFETGGSLVPNDDYSIPQLTMISSVAELEQALQLRPHPLLFFAVSPVWQKAPLELKSMVKGGRTIFYHVQQNGGPSLDVYYPRPFETPNGPQLRPGYLAYHATYWNQLSGAMEPAPAALGDWYKQLRTMLAAGGRRVREGKRTFIVTKNAQQLGVTLSSA
jgi:hypothetical protein